MRKLALTAKIWSESYIITFQKPGYGLSNIIQPIGNHQATPLSPKTSLVGKKKHPLCTYLIQFATCARINNVLTLLSIILHSRKHSFLAKVPHNSQTSMLIMLTSMRMLEIKQFAREASKSGNFIEFLAQRTAFNILFREMGSRRKAQACEGC